MSFFNFRKNNRNVDFLDVEIETKSKELRIKSLLIEHAIDLIAKTISKSEIQVFRKENKKIKKKIDDVYYTLNIRPNPNQDGTTFIYNLVCQLLRENEALVVNLNNNLYIADRWDQTESIMLPKIYSNIYLSDNKGKEIKLQTTVTADDALYMTLGNNEIKNTLDSFYKEYAEMIKASLAAYNRSNYGKFKLGLPTTNAIIKNAATGEEVKIDDYVSKITEGLLEPKDSVIPLSGSFQLEPLGKDKAIESKDTRDLITDFGDKVAMAFNIPLDIYWGKKTEKSEGTNDFLTFAVLPLLKIIQDSFNAKLIEKDTFLQGERIIFDKFTMKHFDIMDVASSLDKLFAIGWSHDDLNEIIGVPLKEEEWAKKHHVTKNYSDVNDIDGKGGE